MTDTPDAATPATVYEKGKINPQTEYVVMRLVDDSALVDDERELWEVGLHVTARSAGEAVRSGSAQTPGQYVAIPARSFRPVKVSVETVSRVKLEDA